MYNRKSRPYLIATYTKQPAKGENTSAKDWGKDAKWEIHETVYFVDRIQNRHTVEAAIIIDILNVKITKIRREQADVSNEEIMKYFFKKYNDKIKLAISNWMQKEGIAPSKEQIEEMEKNIDTPGIIGEVLSKNMDQKEIT